MNGLGRDIARTRLSQPAKAVNDRSSLTVSHVTTRFMNRSGPSAPSLSPDALAVIDSGRIWRGPYLKSRSRPTRRSNDERPQRRTVRRGGEAEEPLLHSTQELAAKVSRREEKGVDAFVNGREAELRWLDNLADPS